jgi:hypothetical protein
MSATEAATVVATEAAAAMSAEAAPTDVAASHMTAAEMAASHMPAAEMATAHMPTAEMATAHMAATMTPAVPATAVPAPGRSRLRHAQQQGADHSCCHRQQNSNSHDVSPRLIRREVPGH